MLLQNFLRNLKIPKRTVVLCKVNFWRHRGECSLNHQRPKESIRIISTRFCSAVSSSKDAARSPRLFTVTESENYFDFINFPRLNPNNTRVMNFSSKDCVIDVVRIGRNDDTFYFLKKQFKYLSIHNDAFFRFSIGRHVLPKFYAGLTYVTGPSDERYDPYKGSFNFAFLLKVQKNNKVSTYVYMILHYRSYIQFNVWQLVSLDDPRRGEILTKPNDELFSNEDIYNLGNAFYAYVVKRMTDDAYVPPYFVKYSESNLLLFGYSKDGYFEQTYQDYDAFNTKINELCNEISDQ